MANNKVQLADGTVLMDVTDTTALASTVKSGDIFYNAAGIRQTGTLIVDETYSIQQNLTNVTSSVDDTKVIAGNCFYTKLTPLEGYNISSVVVTMDGVDITSQVFKPGTGEKVITANGTYNASADSLSGYEQVIVNVPSTAPSLGTKTITENGTYNASSDSLDGYSSVTVNVAGGGGVGLSLSNPPIKAISGTFTLESANNKVTVLIDRNVIDLNDYTLWHFFAIIPDEYWANYEGNSAYDNYAAGLEICRFSNYWASTMVSLSITPMFYEPNANDHSWKTGGSYTNNATANSITFATAGSGYKFLAGVEYRYILICARKVVTT